MIFFIEICIGPSRKITGVYVDSGLECNIVQWALHEGIHCYSEKFQLFWNWKLALGNKKSPQSCIEFNSHRIITFVNSILYFSMHSII